MPIRSCLLWLLVAGFAWCDVKKPAIRRESPEGQFLELVSLEGDIKKRLDLLEQFLRMFPNSEATVWAFGELQDGCRRAGNLDKALDMGEKLLVLDSDNLEAARLNWKIAEIKKDESLIRKWSERTAKIAERVAKMALPVDPEGSDTAQNRVAFARQVVVTTDYAEFNKIVEQKDPRKKAELLDEFVRRSPHSEYRTQIDVLYFLAYKELGDAVKTLAAAEKLLQNGELREDAMLYVAEYYFRRKKEQKRVLDLAAQLAELAATRPKPEGTGDADWIRLKAQISSLAHYMIGSIHFEAEQWPAADRAFRLALPLIQDPQLTASVLHLLGWANYRMKKPLEAIQFYRQCSVIAGPLQETATKSIESIKYEYNLQ